MRALLLIAVLAIAVPVRPDIAPNEEKTPPPVLGDWLYAGNGNPAPQPGNQSLVFRITESETIWMVNGQPSPGNGFTAKVTFDWTKNPIAIDLTPRSGSGIIRGIVRLEGDRFTIAWSGSARPADFTSAQHVHHFTRVKN